MANETNRNTLFSKLFSGGRAGANILYPDEVEAYYLIFELVDADLNPLRSFLFPIMPTEIVEGQKEITQTTNTYGGVHVIKTDTFVPRRVQISGVFGRRIYLVHPVLGTRSVINREAITRLRSVRGDREFNSIFKTGYGALKSLERMKELSKGRGADGRQRYLFLYNPVFGSNYVVEFDTFERLQNADSSNMLYPYKIGLTAVGSVEHLITRTDRGLLATSALIGRVTNTILQGGARNISVASEAFKDRRKLLSFV